jgi:hypothetical protein
LSILGDESLRIAKANEGEAVAIFFFEQAVAISKVIAKRGKVALKPNPTDLPSNQGD